MWEPFHLPLRWSARAKSKRALFALLIPASTLLGIIGEGPMQWAMIDWNATGTWAGAIATFLAALVALFVSVWLPKFQAPKLALDFDEAGDVLRDQAHVVGQGENLRPADFRHPKATFVSMRVRMAAGSVARNCKAYLVQMEKSLSGGAYQPVLWADCIPLNWAYRDEQEGADLLPGVSCRFGVVLVNLGSGQLEIQARLPDRYRAFHSGTDVAYRITVMATAEGAKPITAALLVRRPSSGPLEVYQVTE